MICILDSNQGKQYLESKVVHLTDNQELITEGRTEDCEVMDIHSPVTIDDDLQFSIHLFDGMVPQ